MSNPIGDRPKDPYEHYKMRIKAIEQAEQQKEDEREGGPPQPPKATLYLIAKILQLVHTALRFVLRITGHIASSEAHIHIREHLLQIKIFFEALKREERSQDVIFLNELSDVWHRLLEDSLRLRSHSEAFESLRTFLRDLQAYPPGQEHSFAYYLTEYTGHQWLPFPYLDMIRTMHEEHLLDPTRSALTHWTHAIDHLLDLLLSGDDSA